MRCGRCGETLNGPQCGRCQLVIGWGGAPAPPSVERPIATFVTSQPQASTRSNSTLLWVMVGALVLVAVGSLAALIIFGTGTSEQRAEPAAASSPPVEEQPVVERPAEPSESPADSPDSREGQSSAPEASAAVVLDPEAEAELRLAELRAQALPLVTDGRWVAILAAKAPGMTDPLQVAANGTHTFYLFDILAEHEALRDRLPTSNVLALRRADFGLQGSDLWITVADPGGFSSADDVMAWCAIAFPELSGDELANQCLPQRLTPPHN